jgi:hypothetical protein
MRLDSLLVLKESSVDSDVITIGIDLAELHIVRVDVIAGRRAGLAAGIYRDARPVGGTAAVGAKARSLEARERSWSADAIADAA